MQRRGITFPVIAILVAGLSITSLAQPKLTTIQSDGLLRLCMSEQEFLQGPGREFRLQPRWDDPKLRYTRVYAGADFWELGGYRVQHIHAVGFLRGKLVASVREASRERGDPALHAIMVLLRINLRDSYALVPTEGKRYLDTDRQLRWLILQDSQGNRVQLEWRYVGDILGLELGFLGARVDVDYVSLSYFVADYPPASEERAALLRVCE
jgi:hypothetical protein